MSFPSIPDWDGIHPAMVQFAVVLPWAAALLLLVSLFSRQAWRTWAGAALLVMTVGTLAAWLAVASGHAAGQLVDKTSTIQATIARHEVLGIMMRNLVTILTLVLAVIMVVPGIVSKSMPTAVRITVYALFLVVYLGGTFMIATTASQGGRLVHELGVRAMIGQQTPASGETAARQEAPPPGTLPSQENTAKRP